jgi:hypothetical protein
LAIHLTTNRRACRGDKMTDNVALSVVIWHAAEMAHVARFSSPDSLL